MKKIPPISPETRRRIEEGLRNWGDPNSPARKRYKKAAAKWDRITKPLEKAIADSERLTAEDYSITINAR